MGTLSIMFVDMLLLSFGLLWRGRVLALSVMLMCLRCMVEFMDVGIGAVSVSNLNAGWMMVWSIDYVSVSLAILTVICMGWCSWNYGSWSERGSGKVHTLMWCLVVVLTGLWLSAGFSSFLVWYESLLIPVFCWVGIYGRHGVGARRSHAGMMFVAYTFLGSFGLLVAWSTMLSWVGEVMYYMLPELALEGARGWIVWWGLWLGFMVKVPLFPCYSWLPEAHVEASTEGSVILAAVLLKCGVYGMIRWLLPLDAEVYGSGLVGVLAFVGLLLSCGVTLFQLDMKRFLAYSSVAHMHLLLLGLWWGRAYEGSIWLMLGHGLTSAGMFFAVGWWIDRVKSRLWLYGGGLGVMWAWSFCWLCLTLANLSWPGSLNFVGEVGVLLGLSEWSALGLVGAGVASWFLLVTSILLYARVVGARSRYVFGPVQGPSGTETCLLVCLAVFPYITGVADLWVGRMMI